MSPTFIVFKIITSDSVSVYSVNVYLHMRLHLVTDQLLLLNVKYSQEQA